MPNVGRWLYLILKKDNHNNKPIEETSSSTNFRISNTINNTNKHEDQKILRMLFAGVSEVNYCDCPNSKPGIISYDPFDHLPSCLFRKKIRTGRYSIDTELSLDKIHDGYNLGVAFSD